MIKKYCDLCGEETKKNYLDKFESRNPNASFYLTDKFDFVSEDENFIICAKCCSEKVSQEIDKIDDTFQEMAKDFSIKLWLKLRGIKKVLPIPTKAEEYCSICHKELIPNKDEIWGISSAMFLNEEIDCLCVDCQKFEEEVSGKYLEKPKFKNFYLKELKKLRGGFNMTGFLRKRSERSESGLDEDYTVRRKLE